MPYTHVLLDLDHTLLDTDASLELAFADAMAAANTPVGDSYKVFNDINEALWRRVEAGTLTPPEVHVARFEQLTIALGLDVDPGHMGEAFADGMGRHGDLYDGAVELLNALRGVATLALITNGLSNIQRARIERLDLDQYFQSVTISAEVGISKPNPAIFDITLEALGNPARTSTLMVGDNPGSDIAGGINARVDTCWYNPHRATSHPVHVATHEIQSLHELVPIVSGG